MNVQFRRPQGPCAGLVGEHLEGMLVTTVWLEWGCRRPALLYPLPPAVFTALGHREVLTEQKFGGCEPRK